jgi:hypothetical protein
MDISHRRGLLNWLLISMAYWYVDTVYEHVIFRLTSGIPHDYLDISSQLALDRWMASSPFCVLLRNSIYNDEDI